MRYIIGCLFLLALFACNRTEVDDNQSLDCETEVTYTNEVKAIIDNSCAYAGCHIGGTAPGEFGAYNSLEAYLLNGDFRKRSLQIMDMPPSYAPEGRPKSLTNDELDILNCWVEGEYKE